VSALDDGALRHLLARAGALGLAALVEVHEEQELRRALDAGATIVGVNSRSLRTLAVDRDILERVAAALPADIPAVAESGIRTTADLTRLSELGYHAFLVGERLITQPDPGAALEELRGTGGVQPPSARVTAAPFKR
jgi:indole-3-glycerol phosphate synthase